ncbi:MULTISPECIES: GH25 family lysozyme [unclassified Caballeronia]|uniref:GH25 family lysozyme n=1 Tax=unclassified Caballeronia TaxID=2646786 RepID=UPI002028371B|nr:MULTISPECIES: GH25 family lysozyme [unclassified Caballeronia]MDR5766155.1 GH25 family lysozyme [Caballeronia sp. LZ028]
MPFVNLTIIVCLLGNAPFTVLAQNPVPSGAPATTEPTDTSDTALGLTYLVDDLSRKDLFSIIKNADAMANPDEHAAGVRYFNLYGPFRFPNDVDFDSVLHRPRADSLFGVDISHHTASSFPIEKLRTKKAHFVYMKATQGTKFLDPKFASFWSRVGRLPKGSEVHRGAYHFLSSGDPRVSAGDWGTAQAETFIKVVNANGGLRPTDMPPVVDLEWDKAAKDAPDRWQYRTPPEIITMVKAFMVKVETELKRTPMIYTARSWWHERVGSESQFAALSNYPLWLADYSRKSRATEIPNTINGTHWALWQYTDAAKMAMGFDGDFDANVFKGKTQDFYSTLGVVEFK